MVEFDGLDLREAVDFVGVLQHHVGGFVWETKDRMDADFDGRVFE